MGCLPWMVSLGTAWEGIVVGVQIKIEIKSRNKMCLTLRGQGREKVGIACNDVIY